MRAELLNYDGKICGVKLTATNRDEKDTLRRLFDGGVKPNAMHDKELHLTFVDLVVK